METRKRIFAGVMALCLAAMLGIAAFAAHPSTALANDDMTKAEIKQALTQKRVNKVSKFSVEMLKQLSKGKKNTFISAVSILNAIGMTQNGAQGKTLREIEGLTGLSTKSLNEFMRAYDALLDKAEGEKVSFNSANSVWFNTNSGWKLKDPFLVKLDKFYDAELQKLGFDTSTADKINSWVSDETDGMIKKIVEELDADTQMVLVNALAFEAEWAVPYEKDQIYEQKFTNANGSKSKVDFLHGEEYSYIDDGHATGFTKSYAGGKFKFVALVPNEGTSLNKYLKILSKEKLPKLIANAKHERTMTAMPTFSYDYKESLAGPLQNMGMTTAFDQDFANLTKMVKMPPNENAYISDVLHATHIEVDAMGTKAAAATAVVISKASCVQPQDYHVVTLDRPFVYAIVDAQTNTPLFMGCVKKL